MVRAIHRSSDSLLCGFTTPQTHYSLLACSSITTSSPTMEKEHEENETSLRKLLSSHLSIFNALTNPELDINIPSSPILRDHFTPPPLDFPVAVPWLPTPDTVHDWPRHVHSASASLRPQSASILSTEEEDYASDTPPESPNHNSNSNTHHISTRSESMVMVPLAGVMVFDTDEEDDDYTYVRSATSTYDDDTLTGPDTHKHVATPANLHSAFIMPRMSLADGDDSVQLAIVTTGTVRLDARALMDYVRTVVAPSRRRVHVHHLALARAPLAVELRTVRAAQLLFVINDGLRTVVEFVEALLAGGAVPQLTVINIMTTNYFVNLFDILSATRPHQIWKTPSLGNAAFLTRMSAYIGDQLDTCCPNQENTGESDKLDVRFNRSSVYDALPRPDYRTLERRIRGELLMSLSYTNVDPLHLSSNLSHLRVLAAACTRIFSTSDDSAVLALAVRHAWILCSFSVGIGVGVTLASGAAAHVARNSTAWARSMAALDVAAPCVQLTDRGPLVATEFVEAVVRSVSTTAMALVDAVAALADNVLVHAAVEYLTMAMHELRVVSSLALLSVAGGLRKSSHVLFGTSW